MAKNDYFVIAYRILAYLYACLKSDVKVDTDEISPERLNINLRYWLYILEHLQNDGYIEGVYIGKLLGGMPSVKLEDIAITPSGIEFLQNNSTMAKAKNFLKTLKEIIPGLPD
ncbi:MAG: YjcQ family protein [Ruminococcus sp.]|nr:YjcQ family protein [Ruminococcus sp.]